MQQIFEQHQEGDWQAAQRECRYQCRGRLKSVGRSDATYAIHKCIENEPGVVKHLPFKQIHRFPVVIPRVHLLRAVRRMLIRQAEKQKPMKDHTEGPHVAFRVYLDQGA